MKGVVVAVVVAICAAVWDPAPAEAQGTASCAQTLACVLKCAGQAAACVLTCEQQRSAEAENLYFVLDNCLTSQCPGVPPDPVCVLQAGMGKCKAEYEACVLSGSCQVDCTGKSCGDNGCGGFCGECPEGQACVNFSCTSCTPNCLGKECGDNGCGDMCGSCELGFICKNNKCGPDETCVPNCASKQCGTDGCQGTCGTCGLGFWCNQGICIAGEPPPDAGNGNDDGGGLPVDGDVTTYPPGQCAPCQKLWFGQCVEDKTIPGCEDEPAGGGCAIGTRSAVASLWLLLLAAACLVFRPKNC